METYNRYDIFKQNGTFLKVPFIKLKEKNTPPPTTDDVNVVGALLNYFQNISVKVAQKHYVGVLYYAGKD